MIARWLQRSWFQRRLTPALSLLLPFSGLFGLAAARNRRTQGQRLPVPVIVIGNLTVGGAGKTPLAIALAAALVARGWRPGIVSRGYGGDNARPRPVDAAATAAAVGDEPLLIARRTGCPVYVGRDRVGAGRALLAGHPEVDVLLCDDGLQHYRLARDVEVAVFDGRGAGNGCLLPAGPLREPLARLAAVDAVICHDSPPLAVPPAVPAFAMRLRPGDFYRLGDPEQTCVAAALAGRELHALAGIGDPERFFRTLEGMGLAIVRHPFPDHHAYAAADLAVADTGVLLMTEKDAVKCAGLTTGEAWVLPVEAELPPAFIELVLEKIRGRKAA
ncbi:MAG: tetraacyldisaccharide 4'-kinase [Betaproteobacteria bacterium]|nr:tetraacyldisaccharide 4'-kinase [Betaproteobacteria bacterium]